MNTSEIKIHILHCGNISLSPKMAGFGSGSRVRLPVSVYLIEHPVHGRILVDTGLSSDCNDIMTAPQRLFYKPEITTEETAVFQLEKMGIKPENINVLILTHNDIDHTCALKDFAGKCDRIIMPELEYFWSAKTMYKMRQRWETWMPYKDITERPYFYGSAQGPAGRGFDLFGDDSILCVSTPGHTEGHVSVMVNKAPSGRFLYAGDGIYGGPFAVLAGDAAISCRNLDTGTVPSYCFNAELQLKAMEYLQTLRRAPKCAGIFCSHDPDIAPGSITL